MTVLDGGIQLRTYALLGQMQSQYAAFLGALVRGDAVVAGMAELFVELAPGSEALSLLDAALKRSGARPGFQDVEREYGLIELHSFSIEEVQEAGRAILEACGLTEEERIRPHVVSSRLISKVSPYQAQLINRLRQGSLLLPGETLLVLEVEPAGYVALGANEAEKAAPVKLVHFDPVGRYGRLYLSGSEDAVRTAREAAEAALRQVNGRSL